MWSFFLNIVIGLILGTALSTCALSPEIPAHLIDCYNDSSPIINVPMRLDVFLDLVRKLERLNPNLNMRLMSHSILRSLRHDGIEFSPFVVSSLILPYRATGFQFSKFKILLDYIVHGQHLINPEDMLTQTEKCTLHFMLSSTVDVWVRGDEESICPLIMSSRNKRQSSGYFVETRNLPTNREKPVSRCPVEKGVISTDWGTISPGIIVAAIAAALEPQAILLRDIASATKKAYNTLKANNDLEMLQVETFNVKMMKQLTETEETINNIWAATLAGDLAEVIINQARQIVNTNNPVIGTDNRWNDTLIPRNYHILTNSDTRNWQITDAEILGGIDGLIIANHLTDWVNSMNRLSLSQVIEMYYSESGVSFDKNIKACTRQQNLKNILDSYSLLEETTQFSRVLALNLPTFNIPSDTMTIIRATTIKSFEDYIPKLFYASKHCGVFQNMPIVNMIVTVDGSWKPFENEQFLSGIANVINVAYGRSSLGFINGNNGEWIVATSSNLTTVFSGISGNNICMHNLNLYFDLSQLTILSSQLQNKARRRDPHFPEDLQSVIPSRVKLLLKGQSIPDPNWPDRLNLPRVMTSIIQYMNNRTIEEHESGSSVATPTVAVIVSPTHRINNNDYSRVLEQMATLRTHYFDIFFIYVASDISSYTGLNIANIDESDIFVEVQSTAVEDILNRITGVLKEGRFPKRLIGPHCRSNGTNSIPQVAYEDYVVPDQKIVYRIHPYYLQYQDLVSVTILGQGEIVVCKSSSENEESTMDCKNINNRAIVTFSLNRICYDVTFCHPIYFTVQGLTASNTCSDNDCQLPNQVRFAITHKGLRCLHRSPNDTNSSKLKKSNVITALILLLITYLYY